MGERKGLEQKVLIVSNEPDIKTLLSYLVKRGGHECMECNQNEVLGEFDDSYSIVLLDNDCGRGVRNLRVLRGRSKVPIIYMSVLPKVAAVAEEYDAGFLTKPFLPKDIVEAVKDPTNVEQLGRSKKKEYSLLGRVMNYFFGKD